MPRAQPHEMTAGRPPGGGSVRQPHAMTAGSRDTATVAQLQAAVAELESMPDVHEPVRVMRVEGQG